MGNPPPSPPVILLIVPAQDCIIDTLDSFFSRFFEITMDVASIVTIWFDDIIAFVTSIYETDVSWTFDPENIDPDPIIPVHTIRIVITNGSGSSEKILY
ncbi:hypothetical protein L1994_02720 [Methanomicrobium antiquum]|uniref:Uncharacterized protein n=1 Tax=Methanomicrobium antiquum TaxID=487686 RepID=A0AAF0JMN4_9EURY|nr:hypothetical protein [Methanomicrobium antiquum]WFN37317.1 hypothetical protein L1994_02720 [Methanomicrobium antiquum]